MIYCHFVAFTRQGVTKNTSVSPSTTLIITPTVCIFADKEQKRRMARESKKKRTLAGRLWRLLLVKIPAAFLALTILWVVALKWIPVAVTPLMIQRSIQHIDDKNFHTRKTWVSYGKISPEMARAVIASEDNLFDTHNGFDWKQINQAISDHEQKGKRLRGASTISQQTAKNVFLLPTRSIIRKGFEAYFTVLIEKIWGKRRIMEVYLNVAEMGKGIYGAQAAAERFFNKDAAKLSRREACLIAACLPNPLKRNASAPTQYVSRRASMIEGLETKLLYPDWVYHKKQSGSSVDKGRTGRKTNKGAHKNVHKKTR